MHFYCAIEIVAIWPFSKLDTDSQIEVWALTGPLNIFLGLEPVWFNTGMFRVLVLLEGEPLPQSQVSYRLEQVFK